jgi:hypothetical protein
MLENGHVVESGSYGDLRKKEESNFNEFVKTYNEMKDTLKEASPIANEPSTSKKKEQSSSPAKKPFAGDSKPNEAKKEGPGAEKEKLLDKKKGPSDKIIEKEKIQTGQVDFEKKILKIKFINSS